MKDKKHKGATLPMVIIAIVLLTAAIGITASVLNTSYGQTQRMYNFLTAKYNAVSGSQLALGAYFEGNGKSSDLYSEFSKRAERKTSNSNKVLAAHQFKYGGQAEIEMSGEFLDGSTDRDDYYITITSRAKVANSNDYYVHTVVFNWATSGIRSESGGLESGTKR
ncbi:hypothetical protein [Streptococcus oricebi]|uniref:Type 4 fimbrial biogenesis protein PilX N-terminal domain-containing protein n=1 Tax=Streptococcus oricebi TaxID=1547447 RepID=A0ABS5B6Q0_9STRE|nr:hypothetical protein [Streptococcus oricebi]MBP2624183.1 hypothetical protein [Streptococcus oricebi]